MLRNLFLFAFALTSCVPLIAQCNQSDPPPLSDVCYSLWHQGAAVYDGDKLVPPNVAFERIVNANQGPGRERILRLGSEEMYVALPRVIAACKAEHPIGPNIAWECHHQGKSAILIGLNRAGKYDALRATYHRYQGNNDNRSNLSSCYSNSELSAEVVAACGK